jgi:restriction system protein
MTADEKLQEAFLNRLHRLGGEYFEYFSVYLLEKYSRQNGRRLESLKITAGERDGGIDGEIELTDRLGFRETIYIQAKNWDPDKGDEKLWVVGETLIQQFIGACVCRQSKDRKQHCRGIFITTSRFTPEAKKMLDEMGDKFVGYDGTDLYETAKECGFGIVKVNGEYALDTELLSGIKAFFHMK